MICRCCGEKIATKPLIAYKNMPKSAQFFPDKKTLHKDVGVNLTLTQCPFCGMVQLEGEPVPYFRDVIRAVGISPEMALFRRKQFSDWIEHFELSGKKILEVGCGCGEYMDIMCQLNVNVEGIEHSETAVDKALAKGHTVFRTFIDNVDTKIKGAPYGAFYVLNFLEHIPTPVQFLHGIVNNLSAEAFGLVEVPNFDIVLHKKMYSEFIQDHLLYFTAETLSRLLEWCGFEVLSCKPVWHEYILSAEVRKRNGIDISGFHSQEKLLKNSVVSWLDKMQKEGLRVAVWGASHRTLANLSLWNVSNRLDCVVDSADFKQNKYTPATHLPVVAPAELNARSVGAVLIMADGYSEEIRQIMKEQYAHICCAVLSDNGIEE